MATTKNKPKKKTRFTAQRKAEAICRLLAGADLDVLARELGVPAGKLTEWKRTFLAAGEAALKCRKRSVEQEEVNRLKRIVGELTMRNEILQEGIRIKEGRPFLTKRSRP